MDELTAVLKARALVDKVNPTAPRFSVEQYVQHIGAVLRTADDLEEGEDGYSLEVKGRHHIRVNAKHRIERQRFTACHEIAHIALELPSEHKTAPSWSYAKKSPNEILCDVFAAELLLPYKLFKPEVGKLPIGLAAVEELADRFWASFTATGSRFATMSSAPCAFVLSEGGKTRYSSRSTALREARAWIPPRLPLPSGSLSARLRDGAACDGPEEVDADIWFSDWTRGGSLIEDARYFKKYDQTVSLLWFEDDEVPVQWRSAREEEEAVGLRELDGVLPWPGKSRRKR